MRNEKFLADVARDGAIQDGLTHGLDPWLTILAILVALFAGYAALHLANRLRDAANLHAKTAWLITGAVSTGSGIWSAHLVAISAIEMAVTVRVDNAFTALSVACAVVAGGWALYVASQGDRMPWRLAAVGLLLGGGIAAVHFTAKTAVQFPPTGLPATAGLGPDPAVVAGVVAAATLVICGAALAAALVAQALEVKLRAARHSQGALAAVVDNTADGIIAIDRNGIVRIYNPAAGRMFGYDSGEIVGRNVSILLPAEEREGHEALVREFELRDSRDLGAPRTLIGRRRDGSSIDLEISVSAMHSDEGPMFIGVCHDITQRRQAEKVSQRLGRILDSSFNEIYVFDARTYRFTQVNQGALSNLGYTMEELGQMRPWDLKPEFDAESFAAAVAPLRRGEQELLVFETEHRRRDATLYPVEVRLQLSPTETPPVFVAIIADITERSRAERAIHAAKEAAEVANRAKSEFLATMSHELRTPLNAIIGFSEVIKSETFGPVGSTKYREYAGDIYHSGRHLLDLINDILDLSKVESGKEEIHDENLSVSAVTDAVLRLVGQRAEMRGVALEPQISDDLPGLRADERKLKQILVNLLSNAIKFTEFGGTVTLKVWCSADSGFVFQVIDTGIGIAPEDVPKALSQFGQVDSALNRQHDGTGLGLPLTKSLVELHGGYLDLQSKFGVGTTVTIRLPAWRIVSLPQAAIAPADKALQTG